MVLGQCRYSWGALGSMWGMGGGGETRGWWQWQGDSNGGGMERAVAVEQRGQQWCHGEGGGRSMDSMERVAAVAQRG